MGRLTDGRINPIKVLLIIGGVCIALAAALAVFEHHQWNKICKPECAPYIGRTVSFGFNDKVCVCEIPLPVRNLHQ